MFTTTNTKAAIATAAFAVRGRHAPSIPGCARYELHGSVLIAAVVPLVVGVVLGVLVGVVIGVVVTVLVCDVVGVLDSQSSVSL